MRCGSQTVLGSPGGSLEEDVIGVGAVSAAGTDLGHESAEKVLHDLDREIKELEVSIKEVNSQLKATSLKKQQKERTDKLARLRRELFVAELQLQKSEEEGELNKKDSKSRKLVTGSVKHKSSLSKTSANDRITDSKGVRFKQSDDITLSDLRAMPGLNSDVDMQLRALGLQSESSQSESESGNSNNDSVQVLDLGSDSQASKKSKKSHKSGLYKKSSDTVKFPQIWPHSALQFEYVSESVSFMSLGIKMFVVGDLEVILSKRIGASEKLGRLKLLKKMMYFANIYEWKALLKFYAAWVRGIEIGLSKWSDNSSEIETPMLACFPHKNRNLSRKELPKAQDLVWWCPDYNKQACSLSSSHQKVIKSQTRSVRHLCSVCYKNDKAKLEHPKASSACPYFQK